jgi:tetratricopeptide (TPR) repeat protein
MKLRYVCIIGFIFIVVFSGLCQCTSYSQSLEKFWIDQGNSQLSKGIQDASREQCEKAAKSYQLAININPTSADLWRAKSLSLFTAKKYHDAEISIEKAIDLDPNSAPSWSAKSLILFGEKDRLNESLLSIDKAVELNSSEAAFWVTKGLILSEMKRYEDSFDCFDNATQINPSFAPGWLSKGMIYDILKRYDEALNSYDTAINVDPSYAPAYFYKGNMLAAVERYDEAKECWNKAIDIDHKYKVLEKEMPIFPNATQTRLVVQSIYVDNATREILENLDFLWYVNDPISGNPDTTVCKHCEKTGKKECSQRKAGAGNMLSPWKKGAVTGNDMFAEIKKEIANSSESLSVVPDFTTIVLFRNCITVCAKTSCSSEGSGYLSCQNCQDINTEVAVYVNNDIIVGLAIRFNPVFWSDIQSLAGSAANESWLLESW